MVYQLFKWGKAALRSSKFLTERSFFFWFLYLGVEVKYGAPEFYPFAKPLNEQLQTLKNRMQAHLPCIDRVSFAKYHPHQDMLKSFAESEFDTWCLAHHEAPFRKLHNLTISAENAIPRIVDDLHDINHCSRIQTLLKEGYQSSVAIPCYDNKAFTGFVF